MGRHRSGRIRGAGIVLFLALHVPPVAAHDFWIAPEPLDPQVGQAVLVRLFAGEEFLGDEIPYRVEHAVRFEHVAPDGKADLVGGREGYSPAAIVRPTSAGVHMIAYTSSGTDIELDASWFNRYLEDQEFKAVIAARHKNGQDGAPGRERYFRYAKALVVTQGSAAVPFAASRVLGQKLELVPEFDPVRVAAKLEGIRVRVLFEGKPLAGVPVLAMPQSDPVNGLLHGMTDAEGRVGFALDRPDVWMVKLVHMVPCPTPGADWESSWGSLVFRAG